MSARSRGQAAIELIAAVPLLLLAALLAWQLAAVVVAAVAAGEEARREVVRTAGNSGSAVRAERRIAVPVLIPGLPRLTVAGRAVVRAP